MNSKDRITGVALAAAAAAFFAAAPMAVQAGAHADAEPTGHCVGANACQGQSACATANSSCQGQNSCKGQGFTVTTEAACEEADGEWEAA